MRKSGLFLLFLASSLFGTITEPVTFEIGTGYRFDYLNWKSLTNTENQSLTYQENYKKIQYQQVDATLQVIHRDFYLQFNGGYAAFGRGKVYQTFGNLSFTPEQPTYAFDTRGYDWQTFGLLGYMVNLTPDRFSKIILIPQFGYSGFWKKLKRMCPCQTQQLMGEPPIIYSLMKSKACTSDLKQTWYGPSLGAELRVDPMGKFRFHVGYLFSWYKLRHSSLVDYFVDEYQAGPTLSESSFIRLKEKVKSAHGYGHNGLLQVDYVISKKWIASAVGRYRYFISHKDTIHTNMKTTETFPGNSVSIQKAEDRLKARWWFMSFILEIGYRF